MVSSSEQTDAQKREEQILDDFQTVFDTDAGQRVLRYLEEFCGLQSDCFDPNPYWTAYYSGRRSVGIMILEKLEMSRPEFQQLVRRQMAQEE